MTDIQRKKVTDLINILPDSDKAIFQEIAEYAIGLGYFPTKSKMPFEPVIFTKIIKKLGNCRLCKISPPNSETNNAQKTGFALSFYATVDYSNVFHEGVRLLCESRKSRRTHIGNNNGCNDCNKCTGYFYRYANGKMIGCCHDMLIEIPFINMEHIDEIKQMMKTQHEFWTKHLQPKEHTL